MDQKTIDILTQPVEVHYKPGPGGKKYRYVEGKDVISRLNEAFLHNWSSKVKEVYERDNQIIVLVELEANGVCHQGFGGSEIALYASGAKQGKPVDISNSYKGALTNAMKKAAEQFGIGLTAENEGNSNNRSSKVQDTPFGNRPAVVSNSVVVSAKPSTPNETNPKEIENMLLGKSPMTNDVKAALEKMGALPKLPVGSAAQPQSKTLAQSFKDSGAEQTSPFKPSGNGDEMINDIQLNAIEGLAKLKKVSSNELITKALPGSNKTEYSKLTKDEAKKVILALNTIENPAR